MDSNACDGAGSFSPRSCLAVVLAAGKSTRMQSARPKVLHELAGRSMLGHVLSALQEAGALEIAVVVGPNHHAIIAETKRLKPDAAFAVQSERLGTAHATLAAREAIAKGYEDLLVVFADTPLVWPQTFIAMRKKLARGEDAIIALAFKAKDPAGYGRLIYVDGSLESIREERDATDAEKVINICNAGLMAFDGRRALSLLESIGNANSKKEYYLSDAIAAARARGFGVGSEIAGEVEVMGINDRAQLAAAEAVLQTRLRAAAMRGGATLIDPSSVTFAFDTWLGCDAVIEPHVVFGPGVRVGEGARIRSFSYLEGADIGQNAVIGPFARFCPGTRLEEDVHIGNFVEVNASHISQGTKINHLSYIGDASIGPKTNVGAGTVICNYDGVAKYRTEIGENVFVGSNSAMVAPVKIGSGAYIGSGSVITEDVAPDSLALGRARQIEKPGRGKVLRQRPGKEPRSSAKAQGPAGTPGVSNETDGM